MSHPSLDPYSDLLSEARSVLREDEIREAREGLETLKHQCLEDPMRLYPRETFKPRFVVWELTLRCNMRCRHCGSAAGTSRGHELEPDEALRVCDQLGELGCERLTLLGGEPFLRRDWEAITARLQRCGVRVNVITNGWLTADRELVQRIQDAGLTTFAISVDGYAEKHDELRRCSGAFERILRSFDLANEAGGLSTAAVTTITKLSIDDLGRIYDMLVEHGVRLWQLQVCTAQGRLEAGDPIVPEPDDIRRAADFIVERQREGKIRIDPADNLGYYGPWELEHGFRSTMKGRSRMWSGCQAGCQVLGIDANGDIKGCLSLPSEPQFIEGNLRETPLPEIWWRPGAFAYNREFTLDRLRGYCSRCEYRGLCRAGCVSHAYCTSGDRGDNPSCLHRFLAEGTQR